MPNYDIGITAYGYDKASGAFRAVEGSIQRIFEVATGVLTSRVIEGIASQVSSLVTESIGATAHLQTMQVSLEALASRELVKASGGIATLADVEEDAGKMAGKMMDELAKMSIVSPYMLDTVQSTFRLNSAFGYTFSQSKLMTNGLLQIAAGVGADNDQLNRMAYNLAQVRLQGKVTATDIRQLALAGLDLRDVLQKVSAQYGYEITDHKEFNELVAEGKITWEQFAVGFDKYATEYFGGASEKMAKTLEGLKSTFHDVFALTMPKILSPAVEKVTLFLGKMLDKFIKIRDTDFMEKLADKLSTATDKVLIPLEGLFDKVSKYVRIWLEAKGYISTGLGLDNAAKLLGGLETPLQSVQAFITQVFGEKTGGAINEGINKLIDGFERVKSAITNLMSGNFSAALGDLGVPDNVIDTINKLVDLFKVLFDQAINVWIPKAIELGNYIKDNWPDIMKKAAVALGVFLAVMGGFKVLRTFIPLAAKIAAVIANVVAVIVQAGGLSVFLATLSEIAVVAGPILIGVLGSMISVMLPLMAVIGGLVAAGILLWKNWDTVSAAAQAFIQPLQQSLMPILQNFVAAFGPLREAGLQFLQAFAPIGEFLWTVLKPILEIVGGFLLLLLLNGLSQLVGILTGVIEALTVFVNMLTNVAHAITNIVKGIIDVISGFFGMIIAAATGNSDAFQDSWDKMWKGLREILGGAAQLLISLIVGLFGTLISFFHGFVVGASSIWAGVWATVAQLTSGGIRDIANRMLDGFRSLLDRLSSIGSWFYDAGWSIVQGIQIGIEAGWTALTVWFQSKIAELIATAFSAFGIASPSTVFQYAGKMITAGLKKGVSGIQDVLKDLVVNPLSVLSADLTGNNNNNPSGNIHNNNGSNYYAPVYQIVQQNEQSFYTQSYG